MGELRCQAKEIRSQRSEVRSQRSEVRGGGVEAEVLMEASTTIDDGVASPRSALC